MRRRRLQIVTTVAVVLLLLGYGTAGILTKRSRQAAFDAIPPAVLIAVIAPSAMATGWAETAAAAVTALAATRLPLLGVVAVGVVAVVGFRMVM